MDFSIIPNLFNKRTDEKYVALGFGFMANKVPVILWVDFWLLFD